MRFCICFSYEGSAYSGYQRQGDLKTVQKTIEDVLYRINNSCEVLLVSSGRTDKGVHAFCQLAHFDLSVKITPKQVKRALNTYLPEDIFVRKVIEVPNDFNTRHMVVSKTYQYRLNIGEYDPFRRRFVYQHNYPLDIKAMSEAITYFIGTHDFRAFVTDNVIKENCVRTITEATCKQDPLFKNEIVFTFKGKGFLRYQVRNMVGILIKVGTGKIPKEKVQEILNSKDRSKNGVTAPSCGLTLMDIHLKEPFQSQFEDSL